LLGNLGANDEAFQVASRLTKQSYPGPSLLWNRSMRGVLVSPDFPALATELGLLKYWTTTRTRPDVCLEEAAPAFCKTI
jgi:hypothetical protein